ncbi:MAG: hydrogenase maturation protease [Oleiphilaceae bacterium]|nr:hydrogenase maturation protease [Oleiphilaceae bacterium]
MSYWRVLGIGSPFGDDQLGWHLVSALESLLGTTESGTAAPFSVMALDRPGSGLIQALTGAQGVVVVDALQHMGQTGRIHRLTVADLAQVRGCFSCHSFGVAEALALADELDLLPEHLLILGVEMSASALGDEVSPAVAAAVPELCVLINQTVTEWHSHWPGLDREVKTCV